MRQMLVVAKRELLERVRTKWFLAVTILGPLLMIGMIVVPVLIASRGAAGAHIYVIDASGKLGKPIADDLNAHDFKAEVVPDKSDDALNTDIRTKTIAGYLRIPADIYKGEFDYQGDNASNQAAQFAIMRAVTGAVFTQRAIDMHLKPEEVAKLLTPPNMTSALNTGQGATTSGTAAFFLGYILSFLLYMVITLYCVNVMRSVVSEKTSRVMEFMVAAVKPRDLMGGKILGVGAAGLIQITIWMTVGALALANESTVLAWFGAHGDGPALPDLGADAVAVVIVYFVLGYFFYSALFAAVGSLVSSEQDTQQVQMPVTMILVVGLLCFQVISSDPRGSAATALTNIPLWSPMLMPMRYVLGGATLVDVAISLAVLLVSTILVVRAAAKIYRIGILMYGKRPGFGEVLRWLRHP